MLLFFFVDLGAKLDFSTLGGEVGPAVILSLFVLIGNPLIVMAIMGYMGYRKRTGFLAGLTVAQISEFSIVFVAMGITLGHVGVDLAADIASAGKPAGFPGRAGIGGPVPAQAAFRAARTDQDFEEH